MSVKIPLTKGQYTLIDSCDFVAVTQIGKWCFSASGYAVHHISNDNGKRKVLYMHRVIMQRILGSPIPAGYQVDHISGAEEGKIARLDNRRENLRLATRSQNQAHKGRASNNSSLYKGVSFNQGKWEARIKYEDRRINLGRYADPVLAALTYDVASRYLYNEFAGCNFPDFAPLPAIEERVQAVLARYNVLPDLGR